MGACNWHTFKAVWLSLHVEFDYCPIIAYFQTAPCRSVGRGPPRTNFFSRTSWASEASPPSGTTGTIFLYM